VRLSNSWTGGQYSLYRLVLGLYLAVHFVHLIPWGRELFSSSGMMPGGEASPLFPLFPNILFLWDSPPVVVGLLGAASLLALGFALGISDRVAAVALWYLWACFYTRNPLISNPGLPFIGWLLLAHALMPRAPYGAWHSRGRPDPGSGWRMPQALFAAAWIVMAVSYSYSGLTKLVSPSWIDGSAIGYILENPLARPTMLRDVLLLLPGPVLRVGTWLGLALELAFAPLALMKRARPWLWTLFLGMHLGLLYLLDFTDLSLGMIMIHLFTFDPGWVRAPAMAGRSWVFYDGNCGLCHRLVRFLLSEDRDGRAFRYAPLGSETFARVAESRPVSSLQSVEGTVSPDTIPDSIIVVTPDGRTLMRSRAVIECGMQLGGVWRVLASLFEVVPGSLRDRGYDAVAQVRHKLFRRPEGACPLIPDHLRERFEGL
jgi:predicted DCC family thiol-disulfide oxidoreductase YuxK